MLEGEGEGGTRGQGDKEIVIGRRIRPPCSPLRLSLRHRRLKPVAATVCRDQQVQRRVPGVAALFLQLLRRLMFRADLHEFPVGRVMLAEVGAKPAFAIVYLQHDCLLSFARRRPDEPCRRRKDNHCASRASTADTTSQLLKNGLNFLPPAGGSRSRRLPEAFWAETPLFSRCRHRQHRRHACTPTWRLPGAHATREH
jgi:hypothetical protein